MNRDFDNIFRSKLDNHESEVPSGIWDEIEMAIEPSKEKNRYFLYCLMFLFVCTSVIGILEYQVGNSLSQSTTIRTIQEINDQTSTPKVQKSIIIDQKTDSNLESKLANAQKEFEKRNPIRSNQNKIEVKQEIERESPDLEHYSNKKTKNIFQSIESSRTINSTNSKTISSAIKQLGVKSKTKIKKARNKRKITFTEPMANIKNKLGYLRLKTNSSKKELRTSNKFRDFKKSILKDNDANSKSSIDSKFIKVSPLPSLVFESKDDRLPSPSMRMTVPAATDCPSWVKEKLGFYLEAYYAPEFALRSITAKNRDTLSVTNQNARNESEKSLISYSLGARALFLTPSGISFKLGLNYSQINERFIWQDPESERTVTVVDKDPITGDTLSVNSYIEFGSEKIEIVNRYKSFDIPLLIGFEKYKGKKLSYSMNAGIYLNLISEQRGMFFDPNGNRAWFTSDNSAGNYKAYKSSLGLSFFASAGLMYHWVEGIDFFAEPSVRFYSQSFTLKDYPLNQKYIAVGIHTGIRYRF